MSKRKQHSPEFKAEVALEALKGEEAVSDVNPGDKMVSGIGRMD